MIMEYEPYLGMPYTKVTTQFHAFELEVGRAPAKCEWCVNVTWDGHAQRQQAGFCFSDEMEAERVYKKVRMIMIQGHGAAWCQMLTALSRTRRLGNS